MPVGQDPDNGLCEGVSVVHRPNLNVTTDIPSSEGPSSPTPSSSSLSSTTESDSNNPDETVSFTFSSPLFYDQKLCIYQSLLSIYQQLGKCLTTHPTMLLVLQYSIAAIHGLTVYLLSVILSLAQLIMITATIENLDWIQSYKPLMREWESRFPGFVFPAVDIDSASDNEDDSDNETDSGLDAWSSSSSSSNTRSSTMRHRKKQKSRYGSAHALPLKSGDDVDDGYHSEESIKRMVIGRSMNSILRRRLAKYQHWIPSLWSAEENSVIEEMDQDSQGEQSIADEKTLSGAQDNDASLLSSDTQDGYSSMIRRALVRTISGNIKTSSSSSKSKRVTFNEQVLILGRRLSADLARSRSTRSVSPMTPMSDPHHHSALKTPSPPALAAGGLGKELSSDATPHQTLTTVEMEAMAQEEARYQSSIAAHDLNGSGTSSPVFRPASGPTLVPSPALSSTASSLTTAPTPSPSIIPKDSPDLRRSTSVPHKIGSFFGRHQSIGSNNKSSGSNEPQKNSISRHAATFSESSTVDQNPRAAAAHVTLPSYSPSGPDNATGNQPGTAVSQNKDKENLSPESSPRSSLALGTRAKRSFSLGLPRSNNNANMAGQTGSNSNSNGNDAGSGKGSGVDRQGSNSKANKNFMYRIVHPQRYRRELEEHLTEQERQRLLALAQLQRQQLLAAETSADMAGARDHLCGDAYFYATSAEYIADLGAPNSVISTSIGTSFPEQLQDKKSSGSTRGITKKPRPASYDCSLPPVMLFPGVTGYSSESDSAMETNSLTGDAHQPQQEARIAQQPRSLFKRGRKNNSGSLGSRSLTAPSSSGTIRLQQLFSHPGHKQTQSTSSLIFPPGGSGDFGAASSAHAIGTESVGASLVQEPSSAPVFTSVAAAGAHRLLTRGRSDSRTFTSFTAMGMPAFPPAQPSTGPGAFGSMIKGAQSPNHTTSVDHTSFAAFGFPSPTQSVVDYVPSPSSSLSSSPRHSTISNSLEMLHSDMVFQNEQEPEQGYEQEQWHEQQQQGSMVNGQSQTTDHSASLDGMLLQQQQVQTQLLQHLQELGSISRDKNDASTGPMSANTSRESSMTISSSTSEGSMIEEKESRGKNFMRKFSLKKKTNKTPSTHG
ncbi:hypothetical protein BGZ94_007810 [Podila epigama]|nr:hypothetical protein BGZ94_007810 [Podila epigama]